ncbi:MAG: hypothetical protein ABSE36_08115 [Terracidiphilus sp.]|jgi:hypothetical protein
MPKRIRKLFDRLPLQFRVLVRQFLLRVIDLESLSIEADIPRFLGQFAGVLIFFSLAQAIAALWMSSIGPPLTPAAQLALAWNREQSLISTMMLVVGLITVASWDNTFPDRRDVMVLSPLPVRPIMILIAKVAASAAILGLSILALNIGTGFAWPLILAGFPGVLRFCPAYWFTMIAASLFLYCAVLSVQGFTALLLPRRLFLRLSALLQLGAFGLFPGGYFLLPTFLTARDLADPRNHWILASSPPYWFFAFFNQLNGSLPPAFTRLARRAWIGLGLVVFGAAASLILCYLRTMKRTVEEPDLMPTRGGFHWTPRFGSSLETAIVLFSFRSITRSRQHRVVFAFYFSIVFAVALSMLHDELSALWLHPLTPQFLIPTIVMMALAVVGMRNVFQIPVSLNANWVLRLTQLCPSGRYLAATRRCQILLAVFPVWLLAACLALPFRPWHQVVEHLAILALLGWVFVEISLVGFYKVPFTCSYMPGKTNIQFAFWGFVVVLIVLAVSFAPLEMEALGDPAGFAGLCVALIAAAIGLWTFNRHRAKSAILYFEELPEQLITTLGLSLPPANAEAGRGPVSL